MPESCAPSLHAIEAFIVRWHGTERAERANKDLFLTELCDLLDLPHPDPAGPETCENAYVFERAVPLHHADGRQTTGKIDLYRRGCFVLKAKQASAQARGDVPASAESQQGELALNSVPGTGAGSRATRRADPYGRAMLEARVQAERYIRYLPASEPTPPFLIVVDVGHSFELFADFSQKGRAYLPLPSRSRAKPVWPKERTQQVEAVAAALATETAPVTAAELAATFARGKKEAVAEILSALVVLGRAHRGEKRGTFLASR